MGPGYYKLDVKIAFLHSDLKGEIYMAQPEGFEVKGKEHIICKLKKSLCGLKQALGQWYKKLVGHRYNKTKAEHRV
jgi:hypothetical protein